MEFPVKLSPVDYWTIHWLVLCRHPLRALRRSRHSLALIVAAAVALVLHPAFRGQFGWVVIAGVALFLMEIFSFQRRVRRLYHGGYGAGTTARVDAQGIVFRRGEARRLVKWSELRRVEEYRGAFVLPTRNGRGILLLPKSTLSESQIDQLRALLESYSDTAVSAPTGD